MLIQMPMSRVKTRREDKDVSALATEVKGHHPILCVEVEDKME